jgi:hypothetical protein
VVLLEAKADIWSLFDMRMAALRVLAQKVKEAV